MISQFFHVVFYQPLYNGLVLLIDLLPFFDAGVVVILFTVLVKFILFPLSRKAVRTQLKMKELEPEIQKLKQRYSNDKQKQAEGVVELYKKNKLNPFSSVLLIFIQFPIIFSLFFIFRSGLPEIDATALYSFVSLPQVINMDFLGLVDISQKSLPLALLVGLSTFFQMRIMASKTSPSSSVPGKGADFSQTIQKQMQYIFPVLSIFASYSISGAIGLYWITSNLFTLGQEIFLRKKFSADLILKPKTP